MIDQNSETESRDVLPDPVKQKLKTYVEERLEEIPTKPDPNFPDIEETNEFPIKHDEISSIKFYKIELSHPSGPETHTGMSLKHRRREDLHSHGELRDITTDLYFVTPSSPHEGTETRIEKPDGTFIEAIDNSGGSYELVMSAIKALHNQYPEQFPDIDFSPGSPNEDL